MAVKMMEMDISPGLAVQDSKTMRIIVSTAQPDSSSTAEVDWSRLTECDQTTTIKQTRFAALEATHS